MVDTLLFCFHGLIEGCRGGHTVGVSIDTIQIAKYLGIHLIDQFSHYKFVNSFFLQQMSIKMSLFSVHCLSLKWSITQACKQVDLCDCL